MALGSGRRIVVEFIGDASSLRANARSGEAALQGFSGKAQAAGRIAGKALAGGLLLAGAAAVKATQAAADDQAGQARLAQQLKQSANATDAQVASTEEWITAQGKAKGVADDDLRPALAKLATATGSVDKAQRLATLAMSISAGSGKSLEQVTTALAKAQTGSAAGLAKFGIVTKDVTKDSGALKAAQISATGAQTSYNAAVKAHGKGSAEAKLAADKLSLAQQKLGEAQSKTKSSVISTDEAISRLSDKYKGSAAAAASTTAGKQKILSVQFGELQEQIGAGLLPVMLKLADVGLKVVDWISKNTKAVGIGVAAFGGLLAVTYAVGTAMGIYAAVTGTATAATVLQKAAVGLAAIATKAWALATKAATAAQWLFNAAMDANPIGLVVLAIAALVAGLVIAYKRSETFRNIVNGAFAAVSKAAAVAVNFIKDHWRLLAAILLGPFGIAIGLITKHWSTIKAGAAAVIGWVKSNWPAIKDTIVGPFNTAKTVIGDVWHDVKAGFGGVKDQLTKTVGGIKSAFTSGFNAIKSPIQTVINLVESLIGKIADLVYKLTHIPHPHIPGLGRTSAGGGLGGGIAGALLDGTKGTYASAATALDKSSDKVSKHIKKLKDQLAQVKDAFASLRDSVTGAFTGDLFGASATDAVTDSEGNIVTAAASAGQNFISQLTSQSGTLGKLKAAFKTLQGWGWKPQALAALFQSGNAGLILDLAADKGLATQGASLYNDVTGQSADLGALVGNSIYGDQISGLQGQIAGAGGKGTNNRTYSVTVNVPVNGDPVSTGREIVKTIHALERQTGRQLLVNPA